MECTVAAENVSCYLLPAIQIKYALLIPPHPLRQQYIPYCKV